jgi:hypothetical protein
MSQPIYQNSSMVLYFHPVEKIVHHEFLHRPSGTDFRDLLTQGYEHLRKNRATKWLSDDRNHTVLSEDDEKWARTEWFPLMQKAGWLYWAIVNPAKAVGQLQMKRNVQHMRVGGVTVATFGTVDEAMAWLKTCDRPTKKTA